MASSGKEQRYIYHERQDALLCGQHALNNLVQSQVFSADGLAEIANQLDAMELHQLKSGALEEHNNKRKRIDLSEYRRRLGEGSAHVDESGNFSIEVLKAALLNEFNLTLQYLHPQHIGSKNKDITEYDGFICHSDNHWFAIRKVGGLYWNLNSLNKSPTQLSHFTLAVELEKLVADNKNNNKQVFVVVSENNKKNNGTNLLPIPDPLRRGPSSFWWNMTQLQQGTSTTTLSNNETQWESFSTGGRRLDGKPTSLPQVASVSSSSSSSSSSSPQGSTQDNDLQRALEASLQQSNNNNNKIDVGNKKDQKASLQQQQQQSTASTGDTQKMATIRFRFPKGQSARQEFSQSGLVESLYAFVQQQYPNNNGVELRFGFPPQNLQPNRFNTIESVGLHGECVQCRFI